MTTPALTRWHRMFNAIDHADLTPSDFRIYVTLLKRADFATTEIPEPFQFRSLVKLGEHCHISLATVKRSAAHLELHGWIKRDPGGGRGHRTRYTLDIGSDCDCKQAHSEPVSERKQAQNEPPNRLTASGEDAGQSAFRAEEAVRREEGWGGWPSGSEADWVNRES